MNQRLYLLYQLRKQGLDIRGLAQISMGLVVAHFEYALPAIAGQILVNDLNRIDSVFAKAFRWQLSSIVPSWQKLFHLPSTPPIAYTTCFHQENIDGRCLCIKGHGRVLPLTKTEWYKNSFLIKCLYRYAYLSRRYVIVYISLLSLLLYNILSV